MKKFILAIPVVLAGCFADVPPPETIRSDKCFNVDYAEIVQILDDVVLVNLYQCYAWRVGYGWERDTTCSYSGGESVVDDMAFFAIDKKQFTNPSELYDGRKFEVGDGCFAENGTYSYVTTIGTKKTIRKIKIIKSQVPNPEYEKWKAEQDKKAQDAKNKENADEHK